MSVLTFVASPLIVLRLPFDLLYASVLVCLDGGIVGYLFGKLSDHVDPIPHPNSQIGRRNTTLFFPKRNRRNRHRPNSMSRCRRNSLNSKEGSP